MVQQASLTAVTAARGRAAHLLLDAEPKIFRDDFALQFSGADSEASFRENINAMLAEVAAKAGPDAANNLSGSREPPCSCEAGTRKMR